VAVAEPVVTLEPTRVAVEPGGQASVTVTVFNPGTVVEGYDVSVVSTLDMPWATAVPATLSVYPQQEASATITFAPPRGPQTPGGSFPFGVRLTSQVDPDRAAVAEGDLDIAAVSGLQASLTPVTSKGRWRGRHVLQVDNWGNSPVRLRLDATDPEQGLGFLVSPPVLEVPLGGQGYARIKVRTRHPMLRGSEQRLPFQVACEPESAEPPSGPRAVTSTADRPVVDGVFRQRPILDRWVVLAASLLLAGIIALVVWRLTRDPATTNPNDETVLDAPANLEASAPEPGRVLLSWDAAQAVDGYQVIQTRPTVLEKEVTALVDPENTTRFLVRMEAPTAEEYCYQLKATRENGGESPQSAEACTTTTLAPEVTPSPSPSALVELPPEPGESPAVSGGGTPSPTSPTSTGSPSDSPSPTVSPTVTPSVTVAPTDPPQAFVSVLKLYSGEPTAVPAGVVTDVDLLAAAGVPVKFLHTDLVTLAPGFSTRGWVVYVDAPTAAELDGACLQIVTTHGEVVEGLDCRLAAPRAATPN
jgi:hypothetical protein